MAHRLLGRIVVLVAALYGPALVGQNPLAAEDEADRREQEQLKVESVHLAQHFLVSLRRGRDVRESFDPLYLEEHKLGEGDFRVAPMRVEGTFDIQLGYDLETILCVVKTNESPAEIIVFRSVRRDNKLYLSPPTPPDPKTRTVTPWILRTRVPLDLITSPERQAAMTRLTELGAEVSARRVAFQDAEVTSTDLKYLEPMTGVNEVSLIGCKNVTDAALVHLKGMTNLTSLYLPLTSVSDAATEEAELIARFGNDYRQYITTTGRFLPRCRHFLA